MCISKRTSSKEIIAQYAAEKRVGRQYISLYIPAVSNPRWVSYYDKPAHANWAGRTLKMKNGRHAAISRPSIEERRRLERDTDALVDYCIPPAATVLQDTDTMPIQIQRCAERLLGDAPGQPDGSHHTTASSSLRPKMMARSTPRRRSAVRSLPPPVPALPLPRSDTLSLHLDCFATVPRSWTLGQALQR
eukprot:4138459-Amphidinium_carterae.1